MNTPAGGWPYQRGQGAVGKLSRRQGGGMGGRQNTKQPA